MVLIQADQVMKRARDLTICIVDTDSNHHHPIFDDMIVTGEDSNKKDNNGRCWKCNEDQNDGHGI